MSDIATYRLVKKKWADTAFDGEGAKRFGGRWNSRGKPCVYLAGSESLAILEALVHLDDHRVLKHYTLFQVELPEPEVLHLPLDALPDNWRDSPAPAETAKIGDAWLNETVSPALALPSVIVPRELNFILNPRHPGFESIVNRSRQLEFEPDPRLFAS